MRLLRMALTAGTCAMKRNPMNHGVLTPAPLAACLTNFSWFSRRPYTVNQVTKNINLISRDNNVRIDVNTARRLDPVSPERALVVLLSWLMAKKKHIHKYTKFYMDQGFDVLTVSITPWQLMWPVKGTQLVAWDLLQFLHRNDSYRQLLLHGFSVGGYLWGEALFKMTQDIDLYQPVVDRIVGHIWDSAADITEIPVGFPRAVFPNNVMLRSALEKYMRYHMKTFHDIATCHYIRSSQLFHANLVRSPALFLFSKTDPIGTEQSNMSVLRDWEALGVKCYFKCWDKSPHVGHFLKHPEEYTAELNAFLDHLALGVHPERIQSRL